MAGKKPRDPGGLDLFHGGRLSARCLKNPRLGADFSL
jgi:hypothetical protein